MDNMVWIAQSSEQLTLIMNKTQEFIMITGLTVNYSKSNLIKLTPNLLKHNQLNDSVVQLTVGNQTLIYKYSQDPVCYLDTWIQVNSQKQYQQHLMEKKSQFHTGHSSKSKDY